MLPALFLVLIAQTVYTSTVLVEGAPEKPYLIANAARASGIPVMQIYVFTPDGKIWRHMKAPFPSGVRVQAASNDLNRLVLTVNSMDSFEYDISRDALTSFHPGSVQGPVYSSDDAYVAFSSAAIKTWALEPIDGSFSIFEDYPEIILQANRLVKRRYPLKGFLRMTFPVSFVKTDALIFMSRGGDDKVIYNMLDLKSGEIGSLFPEKDKGFYGVIASNGGSRIAALKPDEKGTVLVAMACPGGKVRPLQRFPKEAQPRLLKFLDDTHFLYRSGNTIYSLNWEGRHQPSPFYQNIGRLLAIGREHIAWMNDKGLHLSHTSGRLIEVKMPEEKMRFFNLFIVD